MLDIIFLSSISRCNDGIMIPYYATSRSNGSPKKFVALKIDGVPVGATFAHSRNLVTRTHKTWDHTYHCIVIPLDVLRTMRVNYVSFDKWEETRFLGKGLSLIKKVVAQYIR